MGIGYSWLGPFKNSARNNKRQNTFKKDIIEMHFVKLLTDFIFDEIVYVYLLTYCVINTY